MSARAFPRITPFLAVILDTTNPAQILRRHARQYGLPEVPDSRTCHAPISTFLPLISRISSALNWLTLMTPDLASLKRCTPAHARRFYFSYKFNATLRISGRETKKYVGEDETPRPSLACLTMCGGVVVCVARAAAWREHRTNGRVTSARKQCWRIKTRKVTDCAAQSAATANFKGSIRKTKTQPYQPD